MKRSTQPSGSTPGKPAGKVNRTGGQNNIKSRKNLFNFKPEKVPHPPQSPVWSVEERRALVEYIALFTPVEQDQLFKWPSFKDINFWEKCADALACTTGMPRRSDIHYENSSTLTSPGNVNSTPQAMLEKNTPLSPILAHSPHANSTNHETYNHGDTIAKVIKLLTLMTSRMRGDLIQNLFWQFMFLELDHDFRAFIPSDFIKLCCKGINRGPGFAYDETVVDDSSAAACNSTSNTNSSEQGSSSILQQAWNETFQVSTQNGVQDEVEDQDTTREKVGADDCLDVETLVDTDDPLELEVNDQVNEEVSYLWARLGSEEKEQIANGDRPIELETFHGIRPQAHKKEKDRSGSDES
ncbi:unnamed protein product [Porites lobata]|uniref:Uncharacterized protein n=1 Tax=Porites lobata TaxID=104759 RepID=A0ABN8QG49_9CNID|nr:unnamed protein product [Porites lobata]